MENILKYSVVVILLFNIFSSLVIALLLYIEAPEREGMGFHKYWQTFVMDAWPDGERKLLNYEDKKRSQFFECYKVITVTCWVLMGVGIASVLIIY
jgi:hypothetical protein